MRALHIGLAFLAIMLAIIMWFSTDEELVVIAKSVNISLAKTDELETFSYDLLTNQTQGYYFDSSYITSISLENTDKVVSLALQSVRIIGDTITIESKKYVPLRLYLRPEIVVSEQDITLLDASLIIQYDNGENLALPFGNFHYLVNMPSQSDFAIGALSATYEVIFGNQTVSSVSMEIHNQTGMMAEITSVFIPSSIATMNLPLARRDQFCSNELTVQECFGLDSYDFHFQPAHKTLSWIILPNQSLEFSIPLSYLIDEPLYRFPIVVNYQVNGIDKWWVMDDFPFMQTALFDENWLEGAITIVHD
jgi:hypothetical protein